MTSTIDPTTTPASAKKSTELSQRVKTAVIGAPAVILLLIFGGRIGTAFLAAGLSLAMLFEFSGMAFELSDQKEKRNLLLGTTWLIAFVNFLIPRQEFELLLLGWFALICYFLWTAARHSGDALTAHFRELLASLFGIIYLGFLPLFLVLVRDSISGARWACLLFLIVWAADTGAYFAGKKWGRRKLLPAISPKKTWEGAAGGLVTAIFITLVYKLTVFRALPWGAIVIAPVFVGAASIVGDLCESFVKRAFGQKDSGSLLPGHGGFLDRFDGVLFGLPVLYACVRIFS